MVVKVTVWNGKTKMGEIVKAWTFIPAEGSELPVLEGKGPSDLLTKVESLGPFEYRME
jgi:hypothetical protein